MLSNQKLQNSLNEIKEISHMDTALFTVKGEAGSTYGGDAVAGGIRTAGGR